MRGLRPPLLFMAYEFLLDPLVKYYSYFGKFPTEVVGHKRGGEWRHSTIQKAKEINVVLPPFPKLIDTFGSYERVKDVAKKVLQKTPERGRIVELSTTLKADLVTELNKFYDEYRRYPKESRGNNWSNDEKILAEHKGLTLSPCPVYCRYYGSISKARDAALKARMANNMIIYCGSEQLAIRW